MRQSSEISETIKYFSKPTYIYGIVFVATSGSAIAVGVSAYSAMLAIFYLLISLVVVSFVLFLAFLIRNIVLMSYWLSYQSYIDDVCASEKRSCLFEGEQGSGKTDTVKRMAIIKAEEQYRQLCKEYWCGLNLYPTFVHDGDMLAIERFKECENVFKFWKNHSNYFPCLCSNVPMLADGKEVCQLSVDSLLQKTNYGYRMVGIIDEIRDFGLTNEDSATTSRELDETLRFLRQFYNGFIYATEQNKNRALLSFRGVTANYTMLEMEHYFRPQRLIKKYDKLFYKFRARYGYGSYELRLSPNNTGTFYKGYYGNDTARNFRFLDVRYKKMKVAHAQRISQSHANWTIDGKDNAFVADMKSISLWLLLAYKPHTPEALELRKLKQKIDRIGFVKYTRMSRGGTEGNIIIDPDGRTVMQNNGLPTKKISYYMPEKRRYQSDTRIFSGINNAKDIKFEPKTWGNQQVITRSQWDKAQELRSKPQENSRVVTHSKDEQAELAKTSQILKK